MLLILFQILLSNSFAGGSMDYACANVDDDSAGISTALQSPTSHGRITLVNDCTLLHPVRIQQGQSIEIPAGVIVTAKLHSNAAAFEMLTRSTLTGAGSIRSLYDSKTKTYSPGIGVLLDGSYSQIDLGEITGFDTGVFICGGCLGQINLGAAYNRVTLRLLSSNTIGVSLDAKMVATNGHPDFHSWVNENHVLVLRGVVQDPKIDESKWMRSIGVYVDSHSKNIPTNNVISGKFEKYRIGMRLSGQYNSLAQLYFELCNTRICSKESIAKIDLAETSWWGANIKNCKDPRKTFYNWWFGTSERVRLPGDPVGESYPRMKIIGSTCDPHAKGLGTHRVRGIDFFE